MNDMNDLLVATSLIEEQRDQRVLCASVKLQNVVVGVVVESLSLRKTNGGRNGNVGLLYRFAGDDIRSVHVWPLVDLILKLNDNIPGPLSFNMFVT
jgi:hypothetical protein